MSLTARNAQVYKGTAAVTYGSGSGVSNRELQGTATITYGGAPTSNTALSLPGTSGNVMNLGPYFPSKADPSTSNVFVEAWVYLNSATNGFVFTVSDSGSEDMGLLVNYASTMQFRVWNTAGSGINSTNNVVLATATWYHVAGSFDRTNNRVYGFVNGVVGSTVGVFSGTARARSSSNMTIGAGNSGTFFPFNGYIRDFRMVNGGIVPTTSFTPAQAPFRLNVPSYITGGSTVLSLAEQYFNPSSLTLPGTNGSYMLFPPTHPVNYDPSTSNVFVEAWVYWNGANWTATNGGAIYEKENVGSTVQDFGLYVDGSVAKLTAYMYTQNGSILRPIYGTALNVKQWYHVAFGYNIANQTAYVWVNGLVGTTSTASNPARYSVTYTFIGNNPFNIPSTYAWNGYIQDLRVTRGGTIPTGNFTPGAAPFGLASPSYVSGGTTVLSLAAQYYQTGMTIKNNASPDIYLAPTGSYPSYTSPGGTAPSFLSDRVRFNPGAVSETSSSCQFVDFGAQTFPMTTSGFSFACKFQFTGSPGFFERIFCINQENVNPSMLFKRNTTSDILLYGYYNPSQQVLANFGSYAQNTTYTIIGIYDPNVGTYGTMYFYKNGVLGTTFTPTAKLANFTSSNVFVGSGRTYSGDGALNADIFYLAMYKRVLSASEITAITASGPSFGPTPTQFTNRPILTPVLTNPGAQTFTIGATTSVSQTALQPANGITWSLAPTGTGLSVTSSTDYALNLSASLAVAQELFTVSATNRDGLTTVTQFTGATPVLNQISSGAAASVVGVYSLRSLRSLYSRVVNIRNGTTSATQDFYADTLGNLTTASGSGQTLVSWLAGATGYVTTLYDQTSNGYNLSQTTTSSQPVINLTTSPYSMIFNGSSTWIYNSSVPFNMGAGSFTLRYVVSNNTGGCILFKAIGIGFTWSTPYEKKFWLGDGTTNEGSSGNYPSHVGNSEDYVLSSTIITAGAKNSIVHKATARTVVPIYVNGNTASLSRNSINMQNDAGNYFIIGRGGNAAYYNGNLFELELFSTPLSDADRVILEVDGVNLPANGGTVTTLDTTIIHTFATVGTSSFIVYRTVTCQVLIVAGGGAGGSDRGGGGGAGGHVYYASQTFTPGVYTVTVGAGGIGTTSGASGGTGTVGGSGGNSSITGLTAAVGGGGGGGCHPTNKTPTTGGSGGGGSQFAGAAAGAAGTAGQGSAGGTGYESGSAGGGGGASSVGANASNAVGGNGGNGVTYSISGTSQTYCGGGGGGVYGPPLLASPGTAGLGGTGGGGNGSNDMTTVNANGKPATYYGGGGGGASLAYTFTTRGGNGFQGIVIVSYTYS